MKSDIEIARETILLPIQEIAAHIGVAPQALEPYGKFKAKLPLTLLDEEKIKQSNLILVTAITPTKAGIGKTTTSVGLALGLNKLNKHAIVALREPSLGPCFGMKGGAAGGGYAQVLPMEDINLHFTGDFHAITTAHNMIAALLDNYIYQNPDNEIKEVVWKRVLDINDRALRQIVTGLGGKSNGVVAESGFDITVASEIMAILCLSENMDDLRKRLGEIIIAYKHDNQPFTLDDLKVTGAITVLLKDAIMPNLVQTTENTPAIIHGGPFANIAHGCNSILATKMAMSMGDYVVTEAGFGADLGAEKFFNIKCRKSGLMPKCTVIVLTSQALKLHAGLVDEAISEPNLEALKKGLDNLNRHIQNIQNFGQPIVLAFNQYAFDIAEEMEYLKAWASKKNIPFAINNSFLKGGEGALELAEAVIKIIEEKPAKQINFTYNNEHSVEEKALAIVQQIYRGEQIIWSKKAKTALNKIKKLGFINWPVCMAKTQYSFSDNPKLINAPTAFSITVEDIVINAGAGFLVLIAGDILRMPGLPKTPQALHIDWVNGGIDGLS